jgi:hypothetical protein
VLAAEDSALCEQVSRLVTPSPHRTQQERPLLMAAARGCLSMGGSRLSAVDSWCTESPAAAASDASSGTRTRQSQRLSRRSRRE